MYYDIKKKDTGIERKKINAKSEKNDIIPSDHPRLEHEAKIIIYFFYQKILFSKTTN